jgi:hypothetical protein
LYEGEKICAITKETIIIIIKEMIISNAQLMSMENIEIMDILTRGWRKQTLLKIHQRRDSESR